MSSDLVPALRDIRFGVYCGSIIPASQHRFGGIGASRGDSAAGWEITYVARRTYCLAGTGGRRDAGFGPPQLRIWPIERHRGAAGGVARFVAARRTSVRWLNVMVALLVLAVFLGLCVALVLLLLAWGNPQP